MLFSVMNTRAADVYNTALAETLRRACQCCGKCTTIHFRYWTGKKSLENPQECKSVPFYEVYSIHIGSRKC